jgi:hypothetical protein
MPQPVKGAVFNVPDITIMQLKGIMEKLKIE